MGQRSHRVRINWEGRPAKAGTQLTYTKSRRSGIRKRENSRHPRMFFKRGVPNKSSHVKPNLHSPYRRLVKRIEMLKKKKSQLSARGGGRREGEKNKAEDSPAERG